LEEEEAHKNNSRSDVRSLLAEDDIGSCCLRHLAAGQ